MISQESARLLAFGVTDEVGGGRIEGRGIDRIEHSLPYPTLPCVGIDSAKFFELLKMPQNGLVARANRTPYVPGSRPIWMLPQVTKDSCAKGVYTKGRNHGFRSLGKRDRRSDISGHPFILSHKDSVYFHCLIQ